MGDGEYDEDDAFEALFAALTDRVEDDGEIGKIAQMPGRIHGRTAGFYGSKRPDGRLTGGYGR